MNLKTATIKKSAQVTFSPEVLKALGGAKVGDEIAFIQIEGGVFIKKVDAEQVRDFLLTDTKATYATD